MHTGKYKLIKRGGRLVLQNVKNSSDKHVFRNEKEMEAFLDNYVWPRGATQSSQF